MCLHKVGSLFPPSKPTKLQMLQSRGRIKALNGPDQADEAKESCQACYAKDHGLDPLSCSHCLRFRVRLRALRFGLRVWTSNCVLGIILGKYIRDRLWAELQVSSP